MKRNIHTLDTRMRPVFLMAAIFWDLSDRSPTKTRQVCLGVAYWASWYLQDERCLAWWPGIDEHLEKCMKSCLECQKKTEIARIGISAAIGVAIRVLVETAHQTCWTISREALFNRSGCTLEVTGSCQELQ